MDQQTLHHAIDAEAAKLIKRHQQYASDLHDHLLRYAARSGVAPAKHILRPTYWDDDPGFDPYHVRKHAHRLARSVFNSLAAGTYIPRPAVLFTLPKAGGGTREVAVFQVVDQALARWLFKRLMDKNKGRLSSRCFAYRTDLTVHDAVLHLASCLAGRKRVFVAEYDFKKYFDSISHKHIEQVLADKRFYITAEERRILWGFTTSSTYQAGAYSVVQHSNRSCGIPQGISTSLFLANIAAYPLDRALEGLRVDFARYADDTIIWSDSYEEVCEAVGRLIDAAKQMGVEFNFKKSDGVRVIVDPGARAEFKSGNYVDFVGYRVGFDKIGIRSSTEEKIKERLSYLVYANLLQQPRRNHFHMHLAAGIDRDYVVMIAQIRRYLYGDVTETMLARYAAGDLPEMRYRGLMSFYPLVDDIQQLSSLDGWLAHTIYYCLRKRTKLFQNHGDMHLPPPHNVAMTDLIHRVDPSIRIPSFIRIAAHLRNAAAAFGPNAVANPAAPSS
jgi:hypothetical protein